MTDEKKPKRGRGRPQIEGKPLLIRLSPELRAIADQMGKGVAADGVREALRLAGASLARQDRARDPEATQAPPKP